MNINSVTSIIIESASEVHNLLGPGFHKDIYRRCLRYEIINRGLKVLDTINFPVRYKELRFDKSYIVDVFVQDLVIVLIIDEENFKELYIKRLYSYMKINNVNSGIIFNFNSIRMAYIIKRIEYTE